MFTDTHSHIHFAKEFPDIEKILERSQKAEVTRQIIVGCTPKDSYEALEFVKKYSEQDFYSTLGVHPHHANELTHEVLERFEKLAQNEAKIVAIGEIGLDYFRNLQPPEAQKQAFRLQLQLAKKLNLTAVVHVREAWEDALQILGEEKNLQVVLHCFSADLAIAKKCWERGYYTSFSGVVTYPKNEYLREVAKNAPQDKMLIETDCPYLTPQTYRGQRNEPAFVVETAKKLAEVRGVDLDLIAEETTLNAQKAFSLATL
jgi:TatD DNase family protein